MDFNKEQLEAINTIDGNVQVIACAGAGKSSSLIERIKNMVLNNDIDEEEILVISFTNASASELKDKLKKNKLHNVTVGTYHSICRSILEDNGYTNCMSFPNTYLVKRELEKYSEERNLNINDVLSWIGYQKCYELTSSATSFKKKDSVYDEYELRNLFKHYETYMKKNNFMDFTDWLTECHSLYKQGKGKHWNYVMIDEAMDSNLIQNKLQKDFSGDKNICIFGDKNQSIYSFQGATPDIFEKFPEYNDNTKVINMNTNYRSCKNIVDAANSFIRPYNKNYKYYKDAIAFNKSQGTIQFYLNIDKDVEADNIVNKIKELIDNGENLNDIAIIYRNNSNADCIEARLKEEDIEYKIYSNSSLFDRTEIKGIISILRLVNSIEDDEAFEILLTTRFYPTTYFKGELIDNLKTEAGKKDCSLYEAFIDYHWDKKWKADNASYLVDYINRLKMQVEKHLSVDKLIGNAVKMFKIENWIREKFTATTIDDKLDSINNLKAIAANNSLEGFVKFCTMGIRKDNDDKDGVTLRTIHSSKGLEYKIVFLIGLEEGKFPSTRDTVENEARLMYVAITRAKEQFYLSSIGESCFYNEYMEGLETNENKW